MLNNEIKRLEMQMQMPVILEWGIFIWSKEEEGMRLLI